MPDIKTLQDFYDPTRTMAVGLQYLQGQQHLALQQQQAAQMSSNQETDNLRQAALVAIKENPMSAPAIYNQYMSKVGGEQVKDPAAFLANPQPFYEQLRYAPGTTEHQAASQRILQMGDTTRKRSQEEFERQMLQEGATQLSVAAGGSSEPATAFALSQSEAGKREAFNKIFDPSTPAKVAANKDYLNQRAGLHAELDPLITVGMKSNDAIENIAPIIQQLSPLVAQRDKDITSLGRTKAQGKMDEAVKSSPEVAEYVARAKASLPQLDQQIQQIKAQKSAVLERAQKLAAGVIPMTDEDNIHAMVGQANAHALTLKYLNAQREIAKDPTNLSKIEAVKQAAQAIDGRIEALHTTRTALDVRQNAAQETARKNAAEELMTSVTNKGQRLFAALPANKRTEEAAAKIAGDLQAQYGIEVGTESIMKGIKKPNQPLVELKVGESLAKEIGPMMGESRSAALGAIETIDTVGRARAAIDNGMVNVGPTATIRQTIGQVAQMLGVGGKDNEEQIVNTRNVIRSLGQFSLAARKQLKGQGQVSDFEGKLLIKAESGDIEDMTLPELKSFLAVTDRLAHRQYDLHQQNVKTMKANPKLAEVAPFYDVPALSAQKPSASDYESLPSGSIYMAPDGTQRRKK